MGGMREVCARVVWVARPKPGLDGVPEWVTGTQCSARVQGDSQLCPHPSPGGPCRWPCASDTPSPGLHPGSRSSPRSRPSPTSPDRDAPKPAYLASVSGTGASGQERRQSVNNVCRTRSRRATWTSLVGGDSRARERSPASGRREARGPRRSRITAMALWAAGGPRWEVHPAVRGGVGSAVRRPHPAAGHPPRPRASPGPALSHGPIPTKSGTDGKVLPGLLGTRALLKGGVGEDTRDPGSPASSGSSFWGWGAERAEPHSEICCGGRGCGLLTLPAWRQGQHLGAQRARERGPRLRAGGGNQTGGPGGLGHCVCPLGRPSPCLAGHAGG